MYNWNGSAWVQVGLDINGEVAGDVSGISVSLSSDGNTVAIGAAGNDGTASNAGHVRVYKGGALDIFENDFARALTLYPNPTNGNVTINFGQQYTELNVMVTDIRGKQVAAFSFGTTNQIAFKLNGASGLYFIKITNKEGKTAMLRVIKK